MRVSALALLVLAATLSARAATEPEEGTSFTPSEELLELFDAVDDDDEPLITPELRAYFDDLPTRAKQLVEQAVEDEIMTEGEHFAAILSLRLQAPALELLMEDYCIVCHADPWQDPDVLLSSDPEANGSPSYMNLEEFTNDVHFRRGVSCAGCHGGDPLDVVMTDPTYESMPTAPTRHEDRTWIPGFCARCHADPAYMRRFDPNLATDQYLKYKDSRHGQLLLGEGDSKPAQCVSCHGAHGIRSPKSPRSSVHPRNVPGTCGQCHGDAEYMQGYQTASGEPLPTDQLEEFRGSIHGRALLERGDLGAPACNDCHGNHASMPPEVSSVAQVCRTCHVGNGELFDGSNHKKAFEENGWPECEQCHGNHAIDEATDRMLSKDSTLCYECHEEHAPDNPECVETAEYFYASISSLADSADSLEGQIHSLAERGLDVDPLAANVSELHDILKRSRSQIHAFDRGEFESVEEMGHDAVTAGWDLVTEAKAEYRFRTIGLVVAVAIMTLLAVLIGFKIRQIEANE